MALKESKIESISFMKVTHIDKNIGYGDFVELLLPSGKRIYAKIVGKIEDERILAITRLNHYQAIKVLLGKKIKKLQKNIIKKFNRK